MRGASLILAAIGLGAVTPAAAMASSRDAGPMCRSVSKSSPEVERKIRKPLVCVKRYLLM